jgi:ribosome-binding ATPase YchF (GTP1/OBG family)
LASSCDVQVDPLDDIDVINLELALADLAQIEKRMDRLKKGEQRTPMHRTAPTACSHGLAAPAGQHAVSRVCQHISWRSNWMSSIT